MEDASSVDEGSNRYDDVSLRTLAGDDLAAVQYLDPDDACSTPTEPGGVCCDAARRDCASCDAFGTADPY